MAEQVFTSVPVEQLTTALTEAVYNRVAPLLQSINKPEPETQLLTRKEAAKLLGVSLPTILDWTKSGKITGYRISSRIRYKRHELETALAKIKTRRS
jgi:excisionase family DNA binding protein